MANAALIGAIPHETRRPEVGANGVDGGNGDQVRSLVVCGRFVFFVVSGAPFLRSVPSTQDPGRRKAGCHTLG